MTVNRISLPKILAMMISACAVLVVQPSPAKGAPSAAALLTNASFGTEFWFALPPLKPWDPSSEHVYIYVTAFEDMQVTLELPLLGQQFTKEVKANQVTTFSTEEGSVQPTWEVEVGERLSPNGLRLHAERPFTASVVSSRDRVSDGFSVIASNKLGLRYRHISHYDAVQPLRPNEHTHGGFLVVATEDGTSVTMTLKGIGGGTTEEGRKIGDRFNISMRRGQVYMLRSGAELPPGTFDLSGTEISANRPIAVISFHERAIMPAANWFVGGLSEMMPPVSAWGTKYYSMEFRAGAGQGTYYRVMAAEDNTRFELRSHDLQSRELIVRKSGLLDRAGDFKEFVEQDPRRSDQGFINGTVVWEADKPILVMKYSFGKNDSEGHPFMIALPAAAQMVRQSLFYVPEISIGNRLHVFVDANNVENPADVLPSLTLNGRPLTELLSIFQVNRIEDFYYGSFEIQHGIFDIQGDIAFNAYIYGDISRSGYGLNAAMAVNKIDEYDIRPPALAIVDNCNRFRVSASETHSDSPGTENRQVDQGIAGIALIEEESFNAAIRYISDPATLNYATRTRQFDFVVEAIDHQEYGRARIVLSDRAGNTTTTTIELPPSDERLRLEDRTNDFGAVRLQQSADIMVPLVNSSDRAVTVEEIRLKQASVYSLVSPPELPLEMAAGGSIDISIAFEPNSEITDPDAGDIDTLVVATECEEHLAGLFRGRGVLPRIRTEGSWDAGKVAIGERVCYEGDEITIYNPGSDVLRVNGFGGSEAPFDLSTIEPGTEFEIEAGASRQLRGMCFAPDAVGEFEVLINVNSDALGDDNTFSFRLRGEGIEEDIVSVNEPGNSAYEVEGCQPNPAGNSTQFVFTLRRDAEIHVSLHDVFGRIVRTLAQGFTSAGSHRLSIPLHEMADGLYFCRLSIAGHNSMHKLLVSRAR